MIKTFIYLLNKSNLYSYVQRGSTLIYLYKYILLKLLVAYNDKILVLERIMTTKYVLVGSLTAGG